MRGYLRRLARSVLRGAGYFFIPLLVVTLLFAGAFIVRSFQLGVGPAVSQAWLDALLIKGSWSLAILRGVRIARKGCS